MTDTASPSPAYSRTEPSPTYRELLRVYEQIHREGLARQEIAGKDLFDGASLLPHLDDIRDLVTATGSRSILDYGSGKARHYEARNLTFAGKTIPSIRTWWGVDEIRCYDPGVAAFASYPDKPADGVICTDVLEHIPEDDIDWMLAELFGLARRFVFANIAGYPAKKTLPNGWNAHVTVMPQEWWRAKIDTAARNWGGERYRFTYIGRATGLQRLGRKLSGRSSKVTTVIAEG